MPFSVTYSRARAPRRSSQPAIPYRCKGRDAPGSRKEPSAALSTADASCATDRPFARLPSGARSPDFASMRFVTAGGVNHNDSPHTEARRDPWPWGLCCSRARCNEPTFVSMLIRLRRHNTEISCGRRCLTTRVRHHGLAEWRAPLGARATFAARQLHLVVGRRRPPQPSRPPRPFCTGCIRSSPMPSRTFVSPAAHHRRPIPHTRENVPAYTRQRLEAKTSAPTTNDARGLMVTRYATTRPNARSLSDWDGAEGRAASRMATRIATHRSPTDRRCP
jgi:hypothetical protein